MQAVFDVRHGSELQALDPVLATRYDHLLALYTSGGTMKSLKKLMFWRAAWWPWRKKHSHVGMHDMSDLEKELAKWEQKHTRAKPKNTPLGTRIDGYPTRVFKYMLDVWAMMFFLNPFKRYATSELEFDIFGPDTGPRKSSRLFATIGAVFGLGLMVTGACAWLYGGFTTDGDENRPYLVLFGTIVWAIHLIPAMILAAIEPWFKTEQTSAHASAGLPLRDRFTACVKERIASARTRMIGEGSLIIKEIEGIKDKVSRLEQQRAMYKEHKRKGNKLAEDMLKSVDDGIAALEAHKKTLEEKQSRVNKLLAACEARLAALAPHFDIRETAQETEAILREIEGFDMRIAKLDAELARVLVEEFALIGRALELGSHYVSIPPARLLADEAADINTAPLHDYVRLEQEVEDLENELISPREEETVH